MKHAVRLALALGLLLGAGAVSAADTATPVGNWKQVDDATGKVKSVIQISETGGELQGKVIQLLNRSPEAIARDGEHPKCDKCDGERKNQPIEGMTIMWGVHKNGDAWDGGKILDPKSGKVYKVKLTLEDGGQKLDVHGYIGFAMLGRSQTWQREQ
ncbi:MAG: hypothetical protein BGP10_00630 [Rhodanobacter sp. 68-29]|uniref:DUF2147 domain-containing protein n=1 Tax=Rhodanobacter sp. PCA2 TaxID=2006117 RepID=UPI00086E1AA8|nr:DUF2147 domain-containing protein [Rhodanobacter sp. PCA2]MBA2078141.1 hypothetical protein [Rhodanobacter sp. PCA2]MBN8923212.1 DUF2147 domain-containing protein [Rhodanobacter sp.]ODU73800.1 MAG: hypothetical protein ABT17_10780 [Rhodanobacter sp. SCN 69-32]OJY59657.1 MAG: hypothetical protein BGP10_00630 [Rhodanobacter sp. 68-29]